MAMKGFVRKFRPLELLNEEQFQAIHRATLDVLQNTGIRIEHERALKLLEKNDCKVDYHDMRVKLPPGLVEECLQKCPSSFRVKARDSKNDLIMGGNTIYFGPAPGKQTVNIDTWEPREATRKEAYDGLIILDALPNVHFLPSYTPYFGFEGLSQVMRIPEICAAKIRNTSKWFFEGYSNDCEIFVIQMAQALGIDIMCSALASPPLTYYGEAMECAFRSAEAGMPVRVLAGAVSGATAPATIAGCTVTTNAEIIAGIVILQLTRPGMRIEVQDFTYPQNMRTGAPAFANIAISLHGALFSQIWRRYGIPTGMTTAYPSSKIPDFQCGYEKAIIAMTAALSGVNLQLVQGAIHGELTHHPIQAIIDDDLVGMIGRFLEGVEVNDDTLALDLISEVGPIPGEFLSKEHTRKWWRKEQYLPQAADLWTYPEWTKRGKKGCVEYAKEKMEEILATHKVTPLTPSQENEIEKILEAARNFYKGRGML
jgi:trimethylamine---corrinoid protein Co-methyltransferase